MSRIPYSEGEPFILAIAGGKPGAGKSLVSSNMAIQYAQAGLKVILIDHDLGAANLDMLFKINKKDQKGPLRQSKLETFFLEQGVPNLLFISGNNFGLDALTLNPTEKIKIFNQIKAISSVDVVIIDLGGGATEQSIDIFLMAHAGLIVTTPDSEGIVSTYKFLKNTLYKSIYRMFRGVDNCQRIVQSFLENKKSSTVRELVAAIEKINPWMAHTLIDICNEFDFYFILNESRSTNDINIAIRLHSLCLKHLNLNLNFAGILYHNDELPSLGLDNTPLSISRPDSITCRVINRMASFTLNHMTTRLLEVVRRSTFDEQLFLADQFAKQDFFEMQFHSSP